MLVEERACGVQHVRGECHGIWLGISPTYLLLEPLVIVKTRRRYVLLEAIAGKPVSV